MERAPQPLAYPVTVSPLSTSSPDPPTRSNLSLIPDSSIQSASEPEVSDKCIAKVSRISPVSESDARVSITVGNELSEQQLIARGRFLLQAYQSQKKQWLASKKDEFIRSSQAHSPDSTVTILNSTINTNGEYSTEDFSSPTKSAGAHLNSNKAPCHDTQSPPQSSTLLPNSILSGLSTMNIGASEVKLNEPLSGDRCEKHWTDFMELLRKNGRTMEKVDAQLARLWSESVAVDTNAPTPQTAEHDVRNAVTQLFQQKRQVEAAILKLAEVLGVRVFLTGKMSDDAVQLVEHQLRLELEASDIVVDRVQAVDNTFNKQDSRSGTTRGNETMQELRQQLHDNNAQLQASRAAMAELKAQLAQQKKSAATRQPPVECTLQSKLHKVEDPRVPTAIQQRAVETKETTFLSIEAAKASRLHRSHRVCARAWEKAGAGHGFRRCNSTPHSSADRLGTEDIDVPPDDKRNHTIVAFSTPLPPGWEMRVTASGAVCFLNKYTSTTTWTDPRQFDLKSLPSRANVLAQQKPLARPSSAMTAELQPFRSHSTGLNALSISNSEHSMSLETPPSFKGSGSFVITGSETREGEESLIDEGTVVDLEHLRASVAQVPIHTAPRSKDDMGVADVILSNLFSLFWKPPKPTSG